MMIREMSCCWIENGGGLGAATAGADANQVVATFVMKSMLDKKALLRNDKV
jgi:hypothetical protein